MLRFSQSRVSQFQKIASKEVETFLFRQAIATNDMPIIGAERVCFLCGSADVEPSDGDCDGAVAACSARHLEVHRPTGLGRCLPFR